MYSLETVVNDWMVDNGRRVRGLMRAKSQEYFNDGLLEFDPAKRTLSEMKLDEIVQHIDLPDGFAKKELNFRYKYSPIMGVRHLFAQNNQDQILEIIPSYFIYSDTPYVNKGARSSRVINLLPNNYYELGELLVVYGDRTMLRQALKVDYQ